MGVPWWTTYFHPTMWEPRSLPLGKIGANQFVHTRSLSKGGNFLRELSNSCNTYFKITYKLRPTWKWSSTVIHVNGNAKVVFPFLVVIEASKRAFNFMFSFNTYYKVEAWYEIYESNWWAKSYATIHRWHHHSLFWFSMEMYCHYMKTESGTGSFKRSQSSLKSSIIGY